MFVVESGSTTLDYGLIIEKRDKIITIPLQYPAGILDIIKAILLYISIRKEV